MKVTPARLSSWIGKSLSGASTRRYTETPSGPGQSIRAHIRHHRRTMAVTKTLDAAKQEFKMWIAYIPAFPRRPPLSRDPHLDVRRRTDGAGGFFLMSVPCNFRRSPSSRNLPIMLAGICSALTGSSWCPDENSSPLSVSAREAFRRACRRPRDSITTHASGAAVRMAVGQPEEFPRSGLRAIPSVSAAEQVPSTGWQNPGPLSKGIARGAGAA
jgi:hypothetical protein